MSDYRRLISYIYAYEGGVKGKNIGFAKLEARGGQCRIQVNVRRIYVGSQDVGVYLLTADREILLGKIFLRGGNGEFRTAVAFQDINGTGRGMDQCYGLTIHSVDDSWRSYTTIWEDAVAHAAEVELEEATSAAAEAREMEKTPPSVITEKNLREMDAAPGESVVESIEREIREQEPEVIQVKTEIPAEVPMAEVPARETPKPGAAERVPQQEAPRSEMENALRPGAQEERVLRLGTSAEAPAEKAAAREAARSGAAEEVPRPGAAPAAGSPLAGQQEAAAGSPQVAEGPQAPAQSAPVTGQSSGQNAAQQSVPVTGQSSGQNAAQQSAPVNGENTAQSAGQQAPAEIPLPAPDSQPDRGDLNRLWAHFQRHYPKIQAFDYNGGCEILLIKPQDIGLLPRETWTYGNNSFLLHGYYNHRYLILARLVGQTGGIRFLLGVPGHYYSNEKYMASMFGFPNFVLSKMQPAGDGRFGYWYTDLRVGDAAGQN